MELLAGFLALIVLLALGFPIFVAIGLSCVVFLQMGVLDPQIFGETMFSGLNEFAFLAIPLFILTGTAIVETGMSQRLLDLSLELFGSLKTGIGTSVSFGSGIFATISGSNAADSAAIGRMALGPLEQVGYDRTYASAMIASGSATGILIPPSISYIIAGIALGVSVSQLFLATFVPGAILLTGVILVNVVINRTRGYETDNREHQGFDASDAAAALWRAKFALFVPFLILGGIYSGVFTATEAAIAAVTVIFVIGALTGTMSLSSYSRVLEESALVNGMIAPIIATALIFGDILTLNQIPQMVAETVTTLSTSYVVMILLMLVVFFVAGATMELGPNILILGPLFLPLAQEFGMDPIHYTIFMMCAFGIGFITPPIGINLYVLSGISGESVMDISREAVPFMLVMLLLVLVIGLVPELSLVFF
ncbi:TRAP transporter large permease [Halalkalicoccus tibetensis]|uniref:TRAP transporter large permease n=1 Tax=Halalkalicoccus tibetensis TaxID=175632 RepID=A0ABD5V619_9EURY